MTEKVLSQDEVDALLKGVSTGDVDTEAEEQQAGGYKVYDFDSQERIIRGRMPGLEMANDAFSRLHRTSLNNLLTRFIDVSIQNVEIIRFADFIKTIPMPSSINLFKMEPFKGMALLVLEAPLVFAFVEVFFGGPKVKYVKSEGRAFTDLEQRVIKKIVDIGLKDLESSWEILAPIKTEYLNTEINPQFVSIVTAQEVVINIEIQVEIEEFSGKMFFCIPYSMIEPIKDKLFTGIHGGQLELDHKWAKLMRESMKEIGLNISTELGTRQVTCEELLNFEVGDVINFSKSVSDDLIVKVEGFPKFMGKPGITKGNQAVKVTGVIG